MSNKPIVIGLFLSSTACVPGLSLRPGPIKFYDGPAQSAPSLAIIENDRNMFLESIDGRDLRRWTQTRDVLSVHVLPGMHVVVAGPSIRAGVISNDAVRLEFIAEAGHRYVVSRRLTGGSTGGAWELVLTDLTLGAQSVGDGGRSIRVFP